MAERIDATCQELAEQRTWVIHFNGVRVESIGYPRNNHFSSRATAFIDLLRRRDYQQRGAHYETRQAFSLTYLPVDYVTGQQVVDESGRYADPVRFAFDRADKGVQGFAKMLSDFGSVRRLGLKEVKNAHIHGLPLNQAVDEHLSFLYGCYTGDFHDVLAPIDYSQLESYLARGPIVLSEPMRLGTKYINVIGISQLPPLLLVALMNEINTYAFSFRYSLRAILLNQEQSLAECASGKHRHSQARYGPLQIVQQSLSKEHVEQRTGENRKATSLANEAAEWGDVIESGAQRFVYFNGSFILAHEDAGYLREMTTELLDYCKRKKIIAAEVPVDTGDAYRQYIGSLPGDIYTGAYRVGGTTQNFAYLLPIPNIWPGLESIPSTLYPPDSPPVFVASGAGATPFRGMGHTTGTKSDILLYGQAGGGKTTFENFYIAQHDRHQDAIADIYDKQYGTYVLGKAMEADRAAHVFSTSPKRPTARFAPLKKATPDNPTAFEHGRNLIRLFTGLAGYDVGKKAFDAIGDGIRTLDKRRSLLKFMENVRDDNVASALDRFQKSPLGPIFFGDDEDDEERPYHFYDFDDIEQMNDPTYTIPLYFHALARTHFRSLARRPMLLCMEEGWRALMQGAIDSNVKTDVSNVIATFFANSLVSFRTRNVTTMFVIHSVDDRERLTSAAGKTLWNKLFHEMPTRIATPLSFLGGEENGVIQMLKEYGFTDRDIAIMRKLERNSDYYYMSELGKRPFSLGLSDVALSLLVSESHNDSRRDLVDQLVEQYGSEWVPEYLRRSGFEQYVDYYLRALDVQNERRGGAVA